ncbi:DUF664 domain-containing protein [Trebonia kvetii]|uniref:DUF664 domain-containing protein n=1 Tax=Trebonia kvetii TaxID=2480626 RepID=A0A6P2C779_9ACTN|nr:DUF664 domain-containing protein [Trebonia kvetii]TVZ05383.1 DUF664 domain-containing protein [Trebonia kvetii]
MAWIAPRVHRVDEPFAGAERPMLEGSLDWGRASLLRKCEGLTGAQLAIRACPPSSLSLLGLIRHMTDVERNWFRRRFGGQDLPALYGEDTDFTEANAATAERDWAALLAEQQAARDAAAALALDATYLSETWGAMTLRWCYSHMIAEYAGHNGHADLLRERIDGATRL